MEISIDLKLMREIVFKDELLLNEMISEWIEDSNNKLIKIKSQQQGAVSSLFNSIHELKTNFSMVHCYQGITQCEKLIASIENNQRIHDDELIILDELLLAVVNKLNHNQTNQ